MTENWVLFTMMIPYTRFLIAAAVLSTATAISAEPEPWSGATWHIWKTDQGCLFYKGAGWSPRGAAEMRKTLYSSLTWEGSACTPGKLINGNGVLAEIYRATRNEGRFTNRWSGTMVNGLMEGTWFFSSDELYAEKTSVPGQYHMGCLIGAKLGGCVPPSDAMISAAEAGAVPGKSKSAKSVPLQRPGGKPPSRRPNRNKPT